MCWEPLKGIVSVDNAGKLEVLSLCAGYGGIELGLERLGLRLRTVAYVEREGFAAANLVAKIEEGKLAAAPVYSDVKTFPYERFRGLVDIMLAGYPCQPFSSAGKRQGEDDPRHLWPHIADGIAACEPSAVFFENVQGHVTLGLRDVLQDLGQLGYRTTWGMFSAAEVGAPHQRKRVFILGWLPDTCGRRLMDAVQRSQREEGVETQEPAWSGGGELADTAGQRDRKSSEGIPVADECISGRQEGSADAGGRLQEELADTKGQRREGWQPEPDLQTGGTVEGTGDASGELAHTYNCRGGKDQQPTQLWSEGIKQPPGNSGSSHPAKEGQGQSWPSRPGQAQYDWEEPRTVANPKGG